MKHRKSITLVLAALLCTSSAYAMTTYTQFGRYLTITNAPASNDLYGIEGVVARDFPTTVTTVGEAMHYTLNNTGYRLLPMVQSSKPVQQLFKQTLPVYLKSIGPMPLNQALLTLSGQSFQLVVDPVHRLVTFRLRNEYQGL